jgi:phage-related protein
MADFSLVPDYTFEQKPQYKTLISNFENGAEQRRPKRSGAITEYKLVYKNRNSTDLGIITALFEARKGSALSFTWLHPISGVTLTVRFKEDSLNPLYTNYGSYDVEFTLTTIL